MHSYCYFTRFYTPAQGVCRGDRWQNCSVTTDESPSPAEIKFGLFFLCSDADQIRTEPGLSQRGFNVFYFFHRSIVINYI